MKKNLVKYALIFWSILIFVLTTFPMREYNGTVETYYDKVAHFFLFGIFSFLLILFLRDSFKKKKLFVVGVISATTYSIVIEFMQVYIPGRSASELDLFAGIFGSFCFSFIFLTVFKNKKND